MFAVIAAIPANTGHSPDAVSMLAHRLRRWPNIETALGECPVFHVMIILARCLRHLPMNSIFGQHLGIIYLSKLANVTLHNGGEILLTNLSWHG